MLDPLDVARAICVLLSREPIDPVDALLVSVKTQDEAGLDYFALAANLYHTGKCRYIVFNGSKGENMTGTPGAAWPGSTVYRERFRALGVPEEAIILSLPARHTRTESDGHLTIAEERGWTRVATFTQPHHMLRVVLGLLRTLIDRNLTSQILVSCISPKILDWWLKVVGSQGVGQATRFDHVAAELQRIELYQAKGDLASFEELFNYLRLHP